MINSFLKAPPPNTITLNVRFQHMDLRSTHTEVQSIAVLQKIFHVGSVLQT